MARYNRKDSIGVRVATILRGAADLVGRTPTPLADAAQALGESLEGGVFALARSARDSVSNGKCPIGFALKMLLTEAAQVVESSSIHR